METETLIGVLLRMLPAILVFILAFVAMSDKKTREQWNNLLYQIGSIRPDQREDEKIGRNVKWPFFFVAACLLLWPIQFFRHATKTIDATASDLRQPAPEPQSDLRPQTPNGNSVSGNAASGNAASDSATVPQGDLQTPTPPASDSPAPKSDLVPAPP